MFKKINLQYLISYLGTLPFIIVILDKFFLYQLDPYIMQDFIIYYSIIIFVFIGSINWNLKKNLTRYLTIYGFFPSLASLFIILLNLYSYKVFLLLIILLLLQLVLDNFIYKKQLERKIYFFIRAPLTFLVVFSLILIQL